MALVGCAKIEGECENKCSLLMNHPGLSGTRTLDYGDTVGIIFISIQPVEAVEQYPVIIALIVGTPSTNKRRGS